MKYAIYSKNKIDDAILKLFKNHEESTNPDFVFSFGGDGTVLKAIKKYIDIADKVKFIGINLGKLGFYSDFDIQELEELIKSIEENKYQTKNYNLLEYKVNDLIGYALNEIVITSPTHTQIIDVYINNKHFESFRGTGLLICTPTGSTAYNKSINGAIIDPSLEACELTEIASINNRVYRTINSPIVLPKEKVIELKSPDFENVFVVVDGINVNINEFSNIKVFLSNKKVTFINKTNYSFFDRVKKAFL